MNEAKTKKLDPPIKRQTPNLQLGAKALVDYESRLAQVMLNHKIVVPVIQTREHDGVMTYFCGVCKKEIKRDGDKWTHE